MLVPWLLFAVAIVVDVESADVVYVVAPDKVASARLSNEFEEPRPFGVWVR